MDGWIECAHKSLTSSATGLSPFKVPLGYKPRMFVGTDKSPPSPHKWTERTPRWPPCYSQGERRVVLLKSLSRTLRCKTKISPCFFQSTALSNQLRTSRQLVFDGSLHTVFDGLWMSGTGSIRSWSGGVWSCLKLQSNQFYTLLIHEYPPVWLN